MAFAPCCNDGSGKVPLLRFFCMWCLAATSFKGTLGWDGFDFLLIPLLGHSTERFSRWSAMSCDTNNVQDAIFPLLEGPMGFCVCPTMSPEWGVSPWFPFSQPPKRALSPKRHPFGSGAEAPSEEEVQKFQLLQAPLRRERCAVKPALKESPFC